MRTTEARPSRSSTRRTSVVASVGACALSLALLLSGTSGAVAEKQNRSEEQDRSERVFPSARDVRDARRQAGDTAALVESAKAELATAQAELEAAALRAEQAAEAYNGARWRLEEATRAAQEARADVRRADQRQVRQRAELAGVVAASYQDGGDVAAVNAVLGSEGPKGLMSQMLAYQGASSSLEARFQQYGATAALAQVFREEAEEAEQRREALLVEAEEARRSAESAAAAASAAADSIAARKEALVRRLAELEGISVELARERQAALEEIERRKQAAAAAAAAAEAAEQADAEAQAAEQAGDGQDEGPSEQSSPSAPSTPSPPPSSTPPAPSGGAGAAIRFAKAQLGEPYVWAAAGPNAWDCSGLTMGAWAAAGVSLPHYSVAQYDVSTPISAGQLRPGDLVFWGSTSSPSSIHHVALYLGGGQIIHAPRTGRPVSIDSMYYWVPPNFFGRV